MSPYLRHLALALVALCLALVSYGLTYRALSERSAAVADLKGQVDGKAAMARRIASARAALSQIAGDESALQSHFVSATGVVLFINRLEEYGKRQGAEVAVSSVSAGGTREQPSFLFTVAITGTFDAVMRTIGMIEYAPYHIAISQVSATKADQGWAANLEFRVGSLAPATSTAPAP